MNFSKRAFISVVRRKANTLILLSIVFILANVLLTTLSVTTALKNTRQSVLSQINPAVSLEVDYQKIMKNPDGDIPVISSDQANQIYDKTKELLKSYDYSMSATGEGPTGFKGSELPGSDSFNFSFSDNAMLPLTGTQMLKPLEVDAGDGKLVKGNGFTEEDIKSGARKGIISKELAETNSLDIGSIIKVSIPIYDTASMSDGGIPKILGKVEEEIEVAGIVDYRAIGEFIKNNKDVNNVDPNDYVIAIQKADRIILPNVALKNIIDKEVAEYEKLGVKLEGNEAKTQYSVVPVYTLKDYKELEKFSEIARTVIPDENIALKSASDSYAQVGKPLESMENLLDIVFVITVVASVIILSLVLCIFMYLRQKEMGIFLALGEKKAR